VRIPYNEYMKLPFKSLLVDKFPFKKNENEEDIFYVKRSDQMRTVDELIQESKLSQSYYFMLFFAAIITVSGIMMQNNLIIIAGMLVAPLLQPILTLSLGFATLNIKLIIRSAAIIITSSGIVIGVGILIPILYAPFIDWTAQVDFVFNSLYFLIAVFAGMASAFAWTKHKVMSNALAGAGIAITLIPPIAAYGILLGQREIAQAEDVLFIFLYNIMTLTAGSALVFALSGFSRAKIVRKEINKQLKNEDRQA